MRLKLPDARVLLLSLRLEVAPEAVLEGPDPGTVNYLRRTSLIQESGPSNNTGRIWIYVKDFYAKYRSESIDKQQF